MSSPVLFLSHAGTDADAALALADRIEASPAARQRGLKVWIDKRCLVPGTSWQAQLEEAIAKGSSAFGVYLTKAGAENWVRMEVRSALDRVVAERRNGTSYPFIPIIADDPIDIGRLPLFAQQYQGVSLKEDAGLQKLIAAILGESPEKRLALVEDPFRGLEAFGPDDVHLFFGRDQETKELISRLRETSLLFVIGDSGSGKSSVVRAGLVPAFREGLLADPRAPRPDTKSWHVVQMRPLSNPLEELIRGVSDAARGVVEVNAPLLNEAYRRIRKADKTDATAVIDALREGAPVNARVLLVIDQFEELWTQTLDATSRDAFLEGVLAATSAPNLRYRAIATMRRDYLFQIAAHDGLRRRVDAELPRTRYNLRRMVDAQLRECVEKPLALAGIDATQASLLADEILRDAGDEPGDLALIEMALFKTWQERLKHATLLDAYKAIGRVEGALGQAADEALDKLGEELGDDGRSLAEAVFVRLVTQSPDGGITRRVGQKSEFAPQAWEVAQRLATRDYNRLLVLGRAKSHSPRDPIDGRTVARTQSCAESIVAATHATPNDACDAPAMTAELAHEQLATQWGQYLRWLRGSTDAADDKRVLDRLIDRVHGWAAGGMRLWDVVASRTEKFEFKRLRKRRPRWLSEEETRFVDRLLLRHWGTRGAGILVALLLGGAIAWAFVSQRHQLVEARATNVWHRLTLSDDLPLSAQEVIALRELAATNSAVKVAFAKKLRTESGLADRFNRQSRVVTLNLAAADLLLREQLIQSVVDVPLPASADLVVQQAVAFLGASLESPRAIEPFLKAIAASRDPDQLHALGQGLAALPVELSAEQAARAIEPFLKAIAASSDDQLHALGRGLAALAGKLKAEQAARAIEPFLKAIAASNNQGLGALGAGLAALAGKLNAEQAAREIEPFLKAIAASNNQQLGTLGAGLAALAGKLNAEQAARAIEPFLKALAASSDPDQLGALGAGLAALGVELSAAQAARAIEPFLKAIAASNNPSQLGALGAGLGALAGELNAEQAARAIEPFLKAIAASSDPVLLGALGAGLAALRVKLSAEQATRAMGPFLKAIAASSDDQLHALGEGLAALAGKLNAEQAARAIEPFLKAIAASSDDQLHALGAGLAALAGKLNAEQAARAIEPFLKAIAASNNQQLGALGAGLGALAGALNAEQAARAIEPFLKAIAASNSPFQLGALGEWLAALAGKLNAEHAARAIETFLKAIAASNNPSQLGALGAGLAALAGKLNAAQAAQAIEPFLKAIAASSDPDKLHALGQGLAALPVELSAEQAARAIEPFLKAIAASSDDQLHALGGGLAALAGKLKAEQAARAIEPFLKAIAAATHPLQLYASSEGFAALAGKLDAEQAAQAIEPFLKAIAASSNPAQLHALGQGLAALAYQVESPDLAARSLVEALRNPFAPADMTQTGVDPFPRTVGGLILKYSC